jgi:hypothetical protein
VKKLLSYLNKNKKAPQPITEQYPLTNQSFLDIHHIYDKNDFIFWWKDLIESNRPLWQDALASDSAGKKVLIATLGAGFSHRPLMTIDNLLNIALTLRGAKVETLLCDHALPVCLKSEYAYIKPEVIHHSQISQTLCKGCYKDNASVSLQLGLPAHNLSTYVTVEERQKAKEIAHSITALSIKDYHIDNVHLGKHAIAGCIRYFAHSNPLEMPLGEEILRLFLESSIITYYSTKTLIERNKYDSVCLTHGTFSPHGVVKETCLSLGIHVICWSVAYMKKRFIFTHGDYSLAMRNEPNEEWRDISWNEKQQQVIMDYLNSRWSGNKDWVQIPKKEKSTSFIEFAKEKNIDLTKPIVGLLTNIVWEAAAEYKSRAFPDMLEWISKTIKYFKKRSDLQLVIRIHPAEVTGNVSQQGALTEIKKMFDVLPKNVFIINPNDNINTYDAMLHCDTVLIYQTQAGHELAMLGVPVIVTAEAWARGKGIMIEPSSENEYFQCLDQLPCKKRLTDETISHARKYAYHAFFRKMIPLSFLEETNDWMLYKPTLNKLDDLLPGMDLGLDIICDGILNQTPFTYPAEKFDA